MLDGLATRNKPSSESIQRPCQPMAASNETILQNDNTLIYNNILLHVSRLDQHAWGKIQRIWGS